MTAWTRTKGILAVVADIVGIFVAVFLVFSLMPSQPIEQKLAFSIIFVIIAIGGLLLFFWWNEDKKEAHQDKNLPLITDSVGQERVKKIVSVTVDVGSSSSGSKEFKIHARKGSKLRILVSSDFPVDIYLLDKWHYDHDDDNAVFKQEDAYEINKDVPLNKDETLFLIMESGKGHTETKVDLLIINE